jgi:hypothetical protein
MAELDGFTPQCFGFETDISGVFLSSAGKSEHHRGNHDEAGYSFHIRNTVCILHNSVKTDSAFCCLTHIESGSE